MKEVGRGGLQDKIIHSIELHGGKAEKTNGAFKKGIADLIIKMPHRPLILAEVKWYGVRKSSALMYPRLAPLQKRFMKDFGSVCLTGAQYKEGIYLWLTTEPDEAIIPDKTKRVLLVDGVFDMRLLLWPNYPHMSVAV